MPDRPTVSEAVIGVTTVAFSKNNELVAKLKQLGFKAVKTNVAGKRFTPEELLDFLSGCDGAIVGLDKINDSVLDHARSVKVIAKYGVGLDNIDLDACSRHDVSIRWKAGVNKRSVAELTLGCTLSLLRNIYVTSNKLKNSDWFKNGGTQLSGKTIGIIGVGNIGKDLVSLLKPFGCRILVNDIIDQSDYYRENGLVEATKEEVYADSDVVTIHTPLTADTSQLINADTLSKMKPTAILLNTARGGIVNLSDLKQALQQGQIAGAALDVYDTEPPADKVLLALPNLINTPHIGGNSAEAVQAMGESAIDGLLSFFRDKN